jgi:hypothetical protein
LLVSEFHTDIPTGQTDAVSSSAVIRGSAEAGHDFMLGDCGDRFCHRL